MLPVKKQICFKTITGDYHDKNSDFGFLTLVMTFTGPWFFPQSLNKCQCKPNLFKESLIKPYCLLQRSESHLLFTSCTGSTQMCFSSGARLEGTQVLCAVISAFMLPHMVQGVREGGFLCVCVGYWRKVICVFDILC